MSAAEQMLGIGGEEDPEELVHGLLDTASEERRRRGLTAILSGVGTSSDREGIEMSPSLISDLSLGPWAASLAATRGGAEEMQRMLAAPSADMRALRARAAHAASLAPQHARLRAILERLARLEPSLLWAFDLPPMREAWPATMLFPTWPILRLINTIPAIIALFHFYKGYLSPVIGLIHPIGAILGPWFYIRRTLKWNLSLVTYGKMLTLALKAAMMPGPSPSQNTVRLGSIIMYIGLFVYGIIQSFQLAAILCGVSQGLVQRANDIRAFIHAARELFLIVHANDPTKIPVFPVIHDGPAGAYQIWNDETIRTKLRVIAQEAYRADALVATAGLLVQGWTIPEWIEDDKDMEVYGLRHPLLPPEQVSNPVSLSRSLILTGPNAAGKTTYMRAVAAAALCAQSLGVVCARRARMPTLHFIGSFVGVADEVGSSSLFEAEAIRCAKLIASAAAISEAGQRALYMLDEPLHSTPPTEGAAMAHAVIRHLGQLPGIRVMATTHYHSLSALADTEPEHFLNISMSAQEVPGGFRFPYRIQRGPSTQCIAINLLRDKGLPEEVIATALKIQGSLSGR